MSDIESTVEKVSKKVDEIIPTKAPSAASNSAGPVANLVATVKKSFKGANAREIFTWARPVASGIIVANIAALLFIFGYCEYTFITFVCRLIQIGLAVVGGLVVLGQISLTSDDIRNLLNNSINVVEPYVASAMDAGFRVLAWADITVSLSVLVGTIVLGFLNAYVPDTALILIMTIVAFGGTPLYFKHQKDIDPHVAKIKKALDDAIDKLPIGHHKKRD